jgi:arylsulfatase A-like enzyme
MLPTLAALTQAKLPAGVQFDGEDRSQALLGTSLPERRSPLYWEYGRNDKYFKYPPKGDRGPNLAMRDGKWKFLINTDGSGGELYDLAQDPNEANNLIATQTEVADRMKARLLAWRASLPQ